MRTPGVCILLLWCRGGEKGRHDVGLECMTTIIWKFSRGGGGAVMCRLMQKETFRAGGGGRIANGEIFANLLRRGNVKMRRESVVVFLYNIDF